MGVALEGEAARSAAQPSRALRDRLVHWRNRLLASPKFQSWAASFPLTRPVARARAAKLFDLCAGFVYTQILRAVVELNLLDMTEEAPASAGEIAERTGLSPAAAERLARGAAAIGLLSRRPDGRFELGQAGAALLGNRSVFAMIRHHDLLYEDLLDPVDFLRKPRGETRLGAFWGYAASDAPETVTAENAGAYSALMAATQGFIAEEVLAAYDFQGHGRLLDIGGGAGAFATAVAARAPDLQITLFDLPAVAEAANARFRAEGIADRARAVGGSFLDDPLPAGADIISLVRVLHDHEDDVVRRLLAAVRRALPAEGRLLIAEPMADAPGAKPMGDAYFGFYLWAMGSGRPRSRKSLTRFLVEAGFENVRSLPARNPVLSQFLLAH